jgi:hypothetical protein
MATTETDYKNEKRRALYNKLEKAAAERRRTGLLDAAVENAWLADQCMRLALSVFADGPDVKAIAAEILEGCNVPKKLDLTVTPPVVDREKITRTLTMQSLQRYTTPEMRRAAFKNVTPEMRKANLAIAQKYIDKSKLRANFGVVTADMSRAALACISPEQKSINGLKGCHVRDHERKNIQKEGCRWCFPEAANGQA